MNDNNPRAEKVKDYIRSNRSECEVYAYGGSFPGPHYKSLWFTPVGTLFVDSDGDRWVTKEWAKRLIRHYSTAKWPLVKSDPNEIPFERKPL